MATMGKYVVAYELAIKTVSCSQCSNIPSADSVGLVEQEQGPGPRYRAGYPHLSVEFTTSANSKLTNQATCPDTSVVMSTLTLSRKFAAT